MAGGEGTACSSSRSHTPIQGPGGQTLRHGEGRTRVPACCFGCGGQCDRGTRTITRALPSPNAGVIIPPLSFPVKRSLRGGGELPSWCRSGPGPPAVLGSIVLSPPLSWAPGLCPQLHPPRPHAEASHGPTRSPLSFPPNAPPRRHPTPGQDEHPCSGTKSLSTVIHLCDDWSNMAPTSDWPHETGAASLLPTAVPSSTQ